MYLKYVSLSLTLLMFSIWGCASASELNGYPDSPTGVVAEYLKQDAKGALLSEPSWREIEIYTTWKAWEELTRVSHIIVDYSIEKEHVDRMKAKVWVKYKYIGRSDDLVNFVPRKEEGKIVFNLEKSGKYWKITTTPAPHIHYETFIRYLRNELEEVKKTPPHEGAYEKLRDDIDKIVENVIETVK